jgi:hypothetical protein
MFQMHRVFCATPWELEAERGRFHDLIGQFNETVALHEGVLYVPVTLASIRDKRPLQYAVDENIRDCRHYILVLSEDWGPIERNFRNDYYLALQSIADPGLPMQSAAVLARMQPSEQLLAGDLPEPSATFSTFAEFDECINGLLSEWFESLRAHSRVSALSRSSSS